MNIKIATYHSSNASPAWLGYVVLPDGKQWLVRFEGNSEADVIARATACYVAEKEKQQRIVGSSDDDEMPSVASQSGKGKVFLGKVWMLNRTTGDRARVLPNELASYEAMGYVRGGPRSK